MLTGVVTLQSLQVYSTLEGDKFFIGITEEASGSDEDSDERKEIDKSLSKLLSSIGVVQVNILHFTEYDQKSGDIEFEVSSPPPRA